MKTGGKPAVQVKYTPKVEIGHIAFEDVPGFGFEVIIVNAHLHIYIACTIEGEQIRRDFGSAVFTDEAQAMVYKEQVKTDRIRARIILPGSPMWKQFAVPTKK
jgi:hypothetical protein